MRCSALIIAVGLMLASQAPARAQREPLPLSLAWQAPAECAQADEVRSELARVTRVRAGFTLTPLDARAEVLRTDQGYTTLLRTERQGERGERQLEARDCRTLVRTVTLVLALAFGAGVELTERTGADDPTTSRPVEQTPRSAESSALEPTTAEPAPATEAPLAPASAPSPSPTSSQAPTSGVGADEDLDADVPAPSAPSSMDLALLVGAGAQLGPLPSPGLALLAGAGLAHGAFALELRVHALPALEQPLSEGVRARFDGLGGAALGCGQLPQGPATLALCAGARAAALRGRSSGASDDASATAPWHALSAVGALVWPNDGLVRLRFETTLSVSLTRPRFVIAGLGPAHRVPRLAPELALLLVVAP